MNKGKNILREGIELAKGLNPLEQLKNGAVDIVKDGLGKAADIFTQVQEGKMDLAEGLQEINRLKIEGEQRIEEQKHEKEMAYFKDMQDVRNFNARIQTSKNSTLLAKVVPYILDIVVVLAFVSMLLVIINHIVPEQNKELFYTAFGGLIALVNQTFNFHRGGNRQGEDAQEQMKEQLLKRFKR